MVDFENPLNNNWSLCSQFTVSNNNVTSRADIVLLVNGLPVVVIELKNPVDKHARLKKAFTQLQNYKSAIPALFCYNGVLVISDGLDAKMGSLSAGWSRFIAWKTVDGINKDLSIRPQIATLIKGMLCPNVLLDLMKQFSVFKKIKKEDAKSGLIYTQTIKKIAAYHQYHSVNKAVASSIRAIRSLSDKPQTKLASSSSLPTVDKQSAGNQKVGIIWHTQGSGKSLSMLFYVGKLVINEQLSNPIILVITDRNDLNDQLFEIFASSKQLLRQTPVQADSRTHLKKLLKTTGGGIVFTTIQKFSPEDINKNAGKFELLSSRSNIIVIVDEAHRSQYGFGEKTLIKNEQAFTKYGFVKYLRDALPSASFIGFTATPIEVFRVGITDM